MSGLLILLAPVLLSVAFGATAVLCYQLRGSTSALQRRGGFLYAATLALLVLAVWADLGTDGFLDSWRWRSGPRTLTWLTAWIVLAVAAGTALFWLELIGNVLARRRGGPGRRAERATAVGQLSAPAFLFVATVTVLAEEFLWRARLVDWSETSLGLPVTGAVILASVSFGINHLYFGVLAAAFKTLHGAVWSMILLGAGLLWVPIAGHYVFDLWVLGHRGVAGPGRPVAVPTSGRPPRPEVMPHGA